MSEKEFCSLTKHENDWMSFALRIKKRTPFNQCSFLLERLTVKAMTLKRGRGIGTIAVEPWIHFTAASKPDEQTIPVLAT